MIDNDFENYYFLYNNLMEEETNYMNNNTIKTNSHKREDIITQILADKGGFRINNDPSLFYEEREIWYLKIKVTKNSETDIVKTSTQIRNKKQFKTTIELDETAPKISYEININKDNYITIYNEKKESISFYNSKMGGSENLSKISTGKKSSSSICSNQSKKSKIIINNCFDFIFRDQTHGDDTYYIAIKQRSHEIDGSLIANNTIKDLKNIVGNIIYYPRDIESTPIQIFKGQKVLIEIKQNTTLRKLFRQMKKLIEDIYEISKENYIYLGFVNKECSLECFSKNDKNEENELVENFIKEIKETTEKYNKFNICLLIIENNEFLGNSLEDRADYPFYYYNLTSQQIDNKMNALESKIDNKINELETKIDDKIKGIQTEIKGIQTEIKGMKNKINDIDSKMEKILDLLNNKIGTKNNNSSGQNSINLSNDNKGSETNF